MSGGEEDHCRDLLKQLEDEVKAEEEYSKLARGAETRVEKVTLLEIAEEEGSHFDLLMKMIDARCPVEIRREAMKLAWKAGKLE